MLSQSIRSLTRLGLSALVGAATLLAGCAHLSGPTGLAEARVQAPLSARVAPGFMWGVATAGFQWEGGDTTSNWASWVAQPGRVPDPIGQAVQGYDRYLQDIDLAHSLGCNTFRFSIEWSKIEPQQGQIDQAAVQHYHDVLNALTERGMTPVVTLMHFAYPAWLEAKGGWTNAEAVQDYVHFVSFVTKEYGSQIPYYLTFNEPNNMLLCAYGNGTFPPGKKLDAIGLFEAADHMIQAHKAAYQVIHQTVPDAKVSFNLYAAQYALGQQPGVVPEPPVAAQGLSAFSTASGPSSEEYYVAKALGEDEKTGKHYLDFVCFDYYCKLWVGFPLKFVADDQWNVYPEGLYNAIKKYHARTHLPVLIAENGMATSDLRPRPDHWTRGEYLVAHVAQVQRAIAEGIPVLGYIHWSITDNYEWGSFTPRFGLYSVNARQGDYSRVPTDGATAYREVIANGGVNPAIQAEFAPPTAAAAVPTTGAPPAGSP